MTVLVTGATGFVGRALLARLLRDSAVSDTVAIRALTRRPDYQFPKNVETVRVDDLAAITDWSAMLRGVEGIVHLAARVHVMGEQTGEAAELYQSINHRATMRLARAAAASGVSRFVFVSSIKVLGECTERGAPFTDASPPTNADDAYARSKLDAEQALRDIANQTGLEVVIVRPPLVYGPGVGANFGTLLRWVERGWPLPLAAIDNRRSLIGVENLVDFLSRCLEHPRAANETFGISDGEDLSTPELVRRIATAQGTAARLVPVPPAVLRVAASILGRGAAVRRLIESLQVDSTRARERLAWTPPIGVDEQLRRTVRGAEDWLTATTSAAE